MHPDRERYYPVPSLRLAGVFTSLRSVISEAEIIAQSIRRNIGQNMPDYGIYVCLRKFEVRYRLDLE